MPIIFEADNAITHFYKHNNEVAKALGEGPLSLQQYVRDAQMVVKDGVFIPEANAYFKFIPGGDKTKVAFVGLRRDGKTITTYHIKTISDLRRKFPGLGL